MPCYRHETRRFVLFPDELLILANTHERFRMDCYRWLSTRFRSFNTGIGRLMDALALECHQRLNDQWEVSQRLGLPDLPMVGQMLPDESLLRTELPFLITNHGEAIETMTQAISDAGKSLQYSVYLMKGNVTPELQEVLETFVKQKHTECRILQDALNACDSAAGKTPLLATA